MSLRRQATSLTMMHAVEVIQPLLVLPYAGRILGAHGFGVYAYAIGIGQIAATFVDYGFHWTGQRAAAAEVNPFAVILPCPGPARAGDSSVRLFLSPCFD